MERLLSMLGAEDPTQKSKEIIELETSLANVSRLLCVGVQACCEGVHITSLLASQITVSEYDDQRKDISTMYNRITLKQLQRMAPSVSVTVL